MTDTPLQTDQPAGIADTAVRVIEAGQRVLLDRFDLARFDVAQLVVHGARAAAAVAAAVVLLTGAWFAVIAAAALHLHGALAVSLPAGLLLVALVSALIGIAILAGAMRRISALEPTVPGLASDDGR